MKKSTFSFIVKRKRHVIKIIEEKNPRALLNYLTLEQEDLSKRIEKWFENPQAALIYLLQEQKLLKEKIDKWMEKVEQQKQIVRRYKEETKLQ